MKNCNIVNELLPLYADDLLSDESTMFLKKNLATCKSCLKNYEDMKLNVNVVVDPENENIKPKKVFDKYLRKVKFMTASLALFTVSIGLFWIDWFIIQYAWSNLYDGMFRIAENTLIPLLVLASIFGIIGVVLITKKNAQTGRNSSFKTGLLIIALVAILVVHIIPIIKLEKTGNHIIAVTNVESIESENDEYFLIIKDLQSEKLIKIKCDENTYSSVIVDRNVLYTFEYRIKLFNEINGVLEQVDTNEIIDNRSSPKSE